MGKPGRIITKDLLPKIKKREKIDITIANGENAAGGLGITPKVFEELLSLGIDVITGGNHIWAKKEIYPVLQKDRRILRPANFPPEAAGRGTVILKSSQGVEVGIINIMGRIFVDYVDCPFRQVEKEIKKCEGVKIKIVDFHAETTSEKQAMGWFLNGKVSAVIGTHTHVPTADEKILPGGTAYITDVGMTGPYDSVLGVKKELAIKRFLTLMPVKFELAKSDIRFCAVKLIVDEKTGCALKIERIEEKLDLSDSEKERKEKSGD